MIRMMKIFEYRIFAENQLKQRPAECCIHNFIHNSKTNVYTKEFQYIQIFQIILLTITIIINNNNISILIHRCNYDNNNKIYFDISIIMNNTRLFVGSLQPVIQIKLCKLPDTAELLQVYVHNIHIIYYYHYDYITIMYVITPRARLYDNGLYILKYKPRPYEILSKICFIHSTILLLFFNHQIMVYNK